MNLLRGIVKTLKVKSLTNPEVWASKGHILGHIGLQEGYLTYHYYPNNIHIVHLLSSDTAYDEIDFSSLKPSKVKVKVIDSGQ